ncbi:MAG: NAD(P)(+) transhydrogenase (Re/Si-specific) subunit beta, partial [Verrucomicrobiota bacterium]
LAVLVTVSGKAVDGAIAWHWILIGLIVGGGIGLVAAKKVAMTGMPEMVALFNGFGGLASLLVGWAEVAKSVELETPLSGFGEGAVIATILIGGITFTGSMIAWAKLSGKMGGAATVFPGQKAINGAIFAALLGFGIAWMISGSPVYLYLVIVAALALGVLGVIPIGGGDMPVVIAFLNSFSGLAAAAAGFVILNNVLIVAGCLVGTSGLILTVIMCKAMNRTLTNVLFGGFGAAGGKKGQQVEGEMKALSIEDAYYVLEAARSVVFVPGYGMAVAQAQHAAKELGEVLEENGAEVAYAIHPVAGRMPGHMNVLLAEADVPYEQLREMDDVNPTIEMVDVAIVVGANDVVNPSAAEDETSPIYGMPIINVHKARTVFALKRGQGAGFSGLVNTLFFRENCRMLYGDAKSTLTGLVSQFKD